MKFWKEVYLNFLRFCVHLMFKSCYIVVPFNSSFCQPNYTMMLGVDFWSKSDKALDQAVRMWRKDEGERQWKGKLKRSWLVKEYNKQRSHLKEMPKGGTNAIGDGTRRRFFSGITACPHYAEPTGSPKWFLLLTIKKAIRMENRHSSILHWRLLQSCFVNNVDYNSWTSFTGDRLYTYTDNINDA